MRLISQGGEYDVNYENCQLETEVLKDGRISVVATNFLDKFPLATYTKATFAEKAMKQMWTKYLEVQENPLKVIVAPKIFQFPREEDLLDG